jgi:hypothetical protein
MSYSHTMEHYLHIKRSGEKAGSVAQVVEQLLKNECSTDT